MVFLERDHSRSKVIWNRCLSSNNTGLTKFSEFNFWVHYPYVKIAINEFVSLKQAPVGFVTDLVFKIGYLKVSALPSNTKNIMKKNKFHF